MFLHVKKDILVVTASLLMTLNLGLFIFTNTARSIIENTDIRIDYYRALIYFFTAVMVYTINSMLAENTFFDMLYTTSIGSQLFIRVYILIITLNIENYLFT